MVEPDGVVTRMLFGLFSKPHSIRYPGGRNVLKPWIKLGWPANNSETRLMTPGVSILRSFSYSQHVKGGGTTATHVWLLKSFMMSRNLL